MFSRRILHAFSRKASVNALPPSREAELQSASRAAAQAPGSSSSGAPTPAISDPDDSKLAPFLSGYAPESAEEGGGLQFYLDDDHAQGTAADATPKPMFARAVHVPWSAPGLAHAGPGAQLERTVRRLLTELAISQTPQPAAADGAPAGTAAAAGAAGAGAPLVSLVPPLPLPAAAMQDLGALSERLRQAGLRVVVTSPARPRANSPLTTRSISSPFLLVIRQTGDGATMSADEPPSFASHSDGEALGAGGHGHPHHAHRHPGHRQHHTATGLGELAHKLHRGGGGGGSGTDYQQAAGEVEVVVVDVALREHLAVAPSTPAYERTLAASVPEMFIGSLSRLSELVRSMASAIQLNFSSQGVCVPPWRRTQALLSRWSVAEDIERQLRLQQRAGVGGAGGGGHGALVDVEALAAASAVASAGMCRQHLGHGGMAAQPPAPLAAQPPLPLHPLLQPLQLGLEAAAAEASAANAGAGGAHRPPPPAPAGLPWAWQQQLRLQAPQLAERRHELDAAMAAAVAAAGAGAGVAEALPEGQVHGGFSASGRQAANRPAMVVLGFVVPSAVEREEQAAAAATAGAAAAASAAAVAGQSGRTDCAGRTVAARARDAWGAEMRPAGGLAGRYGRASSAAASGTGSSTSSTSSSTSTSGSTDGEEASGARSPTSVFRDRVPAAPAGVAGKAAAASAAAAAAEAPAGMMQAGGFGTVQAYTLLG